MTTQEKKDITRQIARLAKLSSEFSHFYSKAVPGFSLPHEARIQAHANVEINMEADMLAEVVGDQKSLVRSFVRYGGYLNHRDGNGKVYEINTAKRLVDYILKTEF